MAEPAPKPRPALSASRARIGLMGLAAVFVAVMIAAALGGPDARPAGADALAILGVAPQAPAPTTSPPARPRN